MQLFYRCLCQDGWFGPICGYRHNLCDSNYHKCASGSTCIPLAQSYECDCPIGRTGKFCEIGRLHQNALLYWRGIGLVLFFFLLKCLRDLFYRIRILWKYSSSNIFFSRRSSVRFVFFWSKIIFIATTGAHIPYKTVFLRVRTETTEW